MRRLLRSPRFKRAVAFLAGKYLSFALRTTRWRVADEAMFTTLVRGQSAVLAFWHEVLPLLPALRVVAEKRADYKPLPIYALVSRHADGQFIGLTIRQLQIMMVSGSSTRGGAAAVREMLGLMANGAIIAVTPDGPRGPARKAAPGVAMLPAMARVPLVPCAVQVTPKLRAGGWDRMVIPLPFARGVIVFGAPIQVPRAGWEGAVGEIETAISAALERAERLCGA